MAKDLSSKAAGDPAIRKAKQKLAKMIDAQEDPTIVATLCNALTRMKLVELRAQDGDFGSELEE